MLILPGNQGNPLALSLAESQSFIVQKIGPERCLRTGG